MKISTKNRGFLAATVALLMLSAMLVTGCGSDITAEKPYTPPPGMGAVKLSFDNNIARTITPVGATLGSFNGFTLQFYNTSGGAAKGPLHRNSSNLNNSVELMYGTYTLIVIAYLDMSGYTDENTSPTTLTRPAAAATVEGINITRGDTTPVTVVLKAFIEKPTGVSADAKGTFSWNITNDIIGLDNAIMTVTPIDDTTVSLTKNFITAGSNDDSLVSTELLDAGYYYVDFVLIKGSDGITFRHVLHIYQNMTSQFTYEFKNVLLNPIIIHGTASFSTPMSYLNPTDFLPILSENGLSPLSKGDTVNVNSGNTATITILNDTDFDEIVFYYNDTTTTVSGGSFDIDTSDPFEVVGLYEITVEGIIDSVPYTTYIYINVTL